MTEQHAEAQSDQGKPAGFFERRWRMIKAAAKQAYEYLFDVKTYVMAGVMFGGVALLNNNTEIGKGIASFFGMQEGTLGVADVALRAGKFILLSTAIRTGIAMAKESYACNDCHTAGHIPNTDAVAKPAPQHGIAQQQEYSQYEVDHGYTPSPLPPMNPVGGAKPPHQPLR